MTFVTLTGIVAGCSGVLLSLSPLLQARRIHRMRESSEVSTGLFSVMRVNSILWVVHGLATHQPEIVVPNAVSLVTASVTLLVIRRYRHANVPAVASVKS